MRWSPSSGCCWSCAARICRHRPRPRDRERKMIGNDDETQKNADADADADGPAREAERRPAGERPVNTAGVKLHPTGRTYEVDAGPLALRRGQRVVIQSERGPEV